MGRTPWARGLKAGLFSLAILVVGVGGAIGVFFVVPALAWAFVALSVVVSLIVGGYEWGRQARLAEEAAQAVRETGPTEEVHARPRGTPAPPPQIKFDDKRTERMRRTLGQ